MTIRNLKWISYAVLLLMAGTVVAGQSTVDEDFMQVMEDRQKSLSSNISLKNSQAATEDVKELQEMFNDVEAYYAHKGNASDAVDWSRESKALTVAIEKYVASKDFDTASQTSVTLAKTCKTCHRVYKKDA